MFEINFTIDGLLTIYILQLYEGGPLSLSSESQTEEQSFEY